MCPILSQGTPITVSSGFSAVLLPGGDIPEGFMGIGGYWQHERHRHVCITGDSAMMSSFRADSLERSGHCAAAAPTRPRILAGQEKSGDPPGKASAVAAAAAAYAAAGCRW
jgi:hypothetical protein